MSQYLNCELVNPETKEVLALFSLPNRFRDMNRDDEFNTYHDNSVPDAKSYMDDHYEGKTTIAKLEAAIRGREKKIADELARKERLEKRICNLKSKELYSDIESEIMGIDEYVEDLRLDIECVRKVITFVEYECQFKDFRNMEDDEEIKPDGTRVKTGTQSLGYPSPRCIDLDKVELNLWLNY